MNSCLPSHRVSPEDAAAVRAAAQGAVASSYLTSPGGVRYGAAVLTRSGRIFSAGQYSSFNHVTNVHAEQAALVLAAMAGDPDVVALAVASTLKHGPTTPCGVCRQVMVEHASRTGRDFEVHLAQPGGEWVSVPLSALLPQAWSARSDERTDRQQSSARPADSLASPHPWESGSTCPPGSHVLVPGGIAIVWDDAPSPDLFLLKLKYTPAPDRTFGKLPHSFTDPIAYESALRDLGLARVSPFGPVAAIAIPDEVEATFPLQAPHATPAGFLDLLTAAGIPPSRVRIGGSISLGLDRPDSDLDVVVSASPHEIAAYRRLALASLGDGSLRFPVQSGTLIALSKGFPGGWDRIRKEERFAETMELGGRKLSLMFVPVQSAGRLLSQQAKPLGYIACSGTVMDAAQAVYKRARFTLQLSGGTRIEVVSYHKWANLVKEGDRLALRGWKVADRGKMLLIQLSPWRDNIVWFPPSA